MGKTSIRTAYMAWMCAVLFYLYQYILRVSPSVMADDLMAAFQVSASGFSSLSAFALYCYALMQVPVGVLVDHYGTRRMVLSSLALCVAGVALFASCDSLVLGYGARMMMGTGSACAFLSVSKIVNEWFPDNRKGLLMGLTATFGTAGALLGGKPLVMLIESQGWRGSLLVLAAIGFGVLLLTFLVLPKAHKGEREIVPGEESASFKAVASVFKIPQVWLFAFVAIGIYLSVSVVADLWGVAFVMEKFGLEKGEAASMMSCLYVGTALGCPVFAWISQAIGSLRQALFIGAVGVVVLLAYIVFVPDVPIGVANAVFFGIGFCTGAEILCFIGVCSFVGPEIAGTMTGFLNGVVTLAGAMIQQHIGIILDYFWDGTMTDGGVPVYSVETYQIAFGVILFFTFLSNILVWLIKPIQGQAKPEERQGLEDASLEGAKKPAHG